MGKLAGLERSKGWVEAVVAAMMVMMTIYGKKVEAGYHDIIAAVSHNRCDYVSEQRKGWMSLFTCSDSVSHLYHQLVPHPWAPPGQLSRAWALSRRSELSRE